MTTRARKTKRNLSQKEREKKKMDDFIKHMEIEGRNIFFFSLRFQKERKKLC